MGASSSYVALSLGSCSMALAMETVLPCTGSGTIDAMRFVSTGCMPNARPTSLTTLRLLSWWKVAICPTESWPYFRARTR
jgi:hypothetical protein